MRRTRTDINRIHRELAKIEDTVMILQRMYKIDTRWSSDIVDRINNVNNSLNSLISSMEDDRNSILEELNEAQTEIDALREWNIQLQEHIDTFE